MSRELPFIDLDTMPELGRLADEVARTGRARVLRRDRKVVAKLVPARRPSRRRPTSSDATAEREAALMSTFGAWKHLVDADQLKRDLNEAQSDDRPAPHL